MDQMRWRTPNKIKSHNGSSVNSPRLYTTPVKQNEIRPKRTAYQKNMGYITVLPSYITPPSGLAKVVRKNPFEADLTNRLHMPMISPTVFTKMPDSLPQQSPEFSWSIDELAHIHPAKIEESPIQQVYSPNPEAELRAQAAIDRFFKENQIIPSPWQVTEKMRKPYIDMDGIPSRITDDMNSTKEFLKSKKEVWTQTVLSLPVNLPQNVEDTLKPFCTFTQDQNTDNEDVNVSNSSLRRKLFFNHECTDNDNESIVSLSSVEMRSMISSSSPPQSGMFIHGALKDSLKNRRHSDTSVSLSSPCISPIRNEDGMPCRKIRRRSRSITRLDDIKDMSICIEESRNLHDDDLLNISRDTNIEDTEDDHKVAIVIANVNNDKTNLCDSASIRTLLKSTNPIGSTVQLNSVGSSDEDHNIISFMARTEINKNSTYKSHKQNITIFDTLDPSCISNSIQDTGYQTYSMNSTMHTVDSYSISMQNHKVQPKEQTLMSKDSAQLSWKEDMRNVFSSTPSKYKRDKES